MRRCSTFSSARDGRCSSRRSTFANWAKQPVFSVVRHVDIGYLAQSLPGEDLVIRSGLLAVRRTSYIIKQDVRKVGSEHARRRGVDRLRRDQSARAAGARSGRVARDASAVAGAGVIALVGDTEIAFDDIGSGLPVVFLHAFPLNRTMWEPQVSALVAECRCIAIDLRGLGESAAVAAVLDGSLRRRRRGGARHAADRARGRSSGLSMGGYVAFALWRRHRERVRALVLADTRAGGGHGREHRAAARA